MPFFLEDVRHHHAERRENGHRRKKQTHGTEHRDDAARGLHLLEEGDDLLAQARWQKLADDRGDLPERCFALQYDAEHTGGKNEHRHDRDEYLESVVLGPDDNLILFYEPPDADAILQLRIAL